jgi:uncharacterized membrane protein
MTEVEVPFNVSNFSSLSGWLHTALAGYPSWAANLLLPGFILAVAFGIWLRTNNSATAAIWLAVANALAISLAGGYMAPAALTLSYFLEGLAVAWLVYLAIKQ